MSRPSLTAINDVGNATERLAAFLDAYREIVALRAEQSRLAWDDRERARLAARIHRLKHDAGERYGVHPMEVVIVGKVLATLVDG